MEVDSLQWSCTTPYVLRNCGMFQNDKHCGKTRQSWRADFTASLYYTQWQHPPCRHR